MSVARLAVAEAFRPIQHLIVRHNPFLIGREQLCHLVLDDPAISKRHARILFDGDQYTIQDLESKNGVLLNGQRVTEAKLSHHDLIRLGPVDLVFEVVLETQVGAEWEQEFEKLKTVVEASRSMRDTLLMDQVLDEIMGALLRLTQADRAFLLVGDADGSLQMERSRNITSEELHSEKYRLSSTAVEQVIRTRQSVVISNASTDPLYGRQTSVVQLDLKTLVCIPIKAVDGGILGILYADSNRKEQEFTHLDIEILECLAGNAAIALEHARLKKDIYEVLREASSILEEVEHKLHLDQSLQSCLRETLSSIDTLTLRLSQTHFEAKD